MFSALKSLEEKAPGPDGFPMHFVVEFWDIIGDEVMQAIHEFHRSGALSQYEYLLHYLDSKKEEPS